MIKSNNRRLVNRSAVAVITAVIIAAISATIASYMLFEGDTSIRHVENIFQKAQAETYARGGIRWAMGEVAKRRHIINKTGLGENGPQDLPVFTYSDGKVSVTAEDVTGKFNINSLSQNMQQPQGKKNLAAFRRLLKFVQLKGSLADAVSDWVDPDKRMFSVNGAEDEYYEGLKAPRYLPANRQFITLDELISVKGFTNDIIKKLRPHITALPNASSQVNINSASAEVLAAVSGLSLGIAKNIIEERKKNGRYNNMQDVQNRNEGLKAGQLGAAGGIITNSGYFLLKAEASFRRARVVYEALSQSQGQQAKIVWLKGV